jgi:hypothetical protein
MVVLSACGSPHTGSMTAPSSIPAVAPVISAAGTQSISARDVSTVSAVDVTVTSLVPGTACPALQFMVSSYVFKASASTEYVNGTCASVRAGTKLTVSGTRPNSNEPLVYVSKAIVKSETTPAPAPAPVPPGSVTTNGLVTGLASGFKCPEQQFMFGTYAFRTATSTRYSGGGCADLKVGANVELAGAYASSDGFVRVTTVSFRTGGTSPSSPTTPPAPTAKPFEAEGVVSAVLAESTCPYLQFTFGSDVFAASRLTQYDGGVCADVTPGAKVVVSGTRRDGDAVVGVLAVVIKHDTPKPAPESEHDPASAPAPAPLPTVEGYFGVYALVSGATCPALQFAVAGYTVKTDLSTEFVDGSCRDVRVRKTLFIRGVLVADHTLLATRVVFDN